MTGEFPRQDVPESEKTEQWFKNCIDYAIFRHMNARRRRLEKIRRQYNGYNGVINESEFAQYNRTYGKENMVKYIDYRLCRTKMDHIVGEQLEAPINGTVYTTNPDAMVRKLENVYPVVGLHYAKKEVNDVRQKVGVNVFDGMQSPEVPEGQTIFDLLSPKSKNERNMQLILDRQIVDMDLKLKFSDNMYDLVLQSETFGKSYIDDEGNVKYRSIPVESAIYEESEGDPFIEKSPYVGEERTLFIHDVLQEVRPSKEIATRLQKIASGRETIDSEFAGHYEEIQGLKAFKVYTIHWKGCEVTYLKSGKDKTGEQIDSEMSQAYYNKNKKRIEYDVQNGKYDVQAKYSFPWYEATRIGHDIYVNMRKVQNMPFNNENPSNTIPQYQGLLFNTRGGIRVSIKQLTEHIDRMYNMVMWQINRELAKSKGKVLFYDLAFLPKGKKLTDVMYNMTNDQVVPYNSSADGNKYGKEGAGALGISEADMGISNTVNILIPLKLNLEQMADKITGIVAGRMGSVAASATVTNTKESIDNSLTTTAPLFFYFAKFQERHLRAILELSKLSWGILKPEKGEMILGMDGMKYMSSTEDIPFDDYGYTLADSRKEQDVRAMLRQYMSVALNVNPDLIDAAIDSEIAQTSTEALMTIKKTLKELRKIKEQEAQAQQQAAVQQQQQSDQGQVDLMNQKAQNTAKEIALRGNVDIAKNTSKSMDAHVLAQNQPQQQAVRK